MQEWWSSLDWFSQILWGTSLIGSLIFSILMILNLIGGDTDLDMDDVDTSIEGDTGIGFGFFSLKNLVGFFTIFGWTGLACYESGMGKLGSTGIAFLAGLAMMVIMASIFYGISKLASSGTLKMKNAIGNYGETYLIIPKNRTGMGKVQIKVQGSLRELDAMTNDEVDIQTGTLIKVDQIINGNILVVSRANK
jgi:hypothetical protein